jgi:hypothetical protein
MSVKRVRRVSANSSLSSRAPSSLDTSHSAATNQVQLSGHSVT